LKGLALGIEKILNLIFDFALGKGLNGTFTKIEDELSPMFLIHPPKHELQKVNIKN